MRSRFTFSSAAASRVRRWRVFAAIALSAVGAEGVVGAAHAQSCPPKLTYYPVRGPHNNGYDSTAGNSSLWSCDDANSNSDFIAANARHLGNDVWAPAGTPVVATTSGV